MERLKIPITALSMLKNILGVECKGFENKRIAVNNIKKKNIMLRLYFENNKPSSDLIVIIFSKLIVYLSPAGKNIVAWVK